MIFFAYNHIRLDGKLELSSLYTSACRSLGACATRGGQALPDCQAKPDLHSQSRQQ